MANNAAPPRAGRTDFSHQKRLTVSSGLDTITFFPCIEIVPGNAVGGWMQTDLVLELTPTD
jgi:hypothetical protein